MEEDFSHLLQGQENEIEFVVSHDEIQDSVAELFQTHTRFSIPVSQLVTTGEFTNWWVQTEVYPKLSNAIRNTLLGTPQGHLTMPHPDKPLEHITLGDLAVNSIDNAVEDMDLQGQSYLTFSLIAKPLDRFGASKLLRILNAVQDKGISARVGIHLSSKPFGFLCTALPKFRRSANYAAASSRLTRRSTPTSTSQSRVLPPGSISIPQVSNPGFIPPGHRSTSALVVLEAASQSQEQHYPETPSSSSSIAASDTSDTPASAAPVPTTVLSINPGVWRIKSWAAHLLTHNPAPADTPAHVTDTAQDKIVFDAIAPLPIVAPMVPVQDAPAPYDACTSVPMQPENPRLLLMQTIGSNNQVCFHGAVEQECCTDSIPIDLPSPAEHTVTFPSLKLHGLQAVPINAKEGQVPLTETREGIDGSDMTAGSKIREGPSQRLCHCNSPDHVICNCPMASAQVKSTFVKKKCPFHMRLVMPSEIIDSEGVLHVLTTTDAPREDASPLPDSVCFDAPDHLAPAAAIDAALQACSLSLASMDDPKDDYVTTLPLSFAEDTSVADNTQHIPQGVSFLRVPACTLPGATPASLRLPAAQSVSISAKEGQVPLTETREGIERTDPREGDMPSAKEGPMQHLRHCITCSARPCDIYRDEDYCLPCDPMVPSSVEPAPAHVVHHPTCDQLRILWHQHPMLQLASWTLGLKMNCTSVPSAVWSNSTRPIRALRNLGEPLCATKVSPLSKVPSNQPPNWATMKEHMHHVSNSHVNISSSL
jgi:hypothetical protein